MSSISTPEENSLLCNHSVSTAYSLKDEGNAQFKAKKYKDAIRCYYKSVLHIKGLMGPDDEYFLYSKKETRISTAQAESIRELYSILFSNMSQCHLLLGNYKKAQDNADKALKLKETAKALYRRGVAELYLKDFDNALVDFKKCLEIDPSNGEIGSYIQKAEQGIKESEKDLGEKLKKAFN